MQSIITNLCIYIWLLGKWANQAVSNELWLVGLIIQTFNSLWSDLSCVVSSVAIFFVIASSTKLCHCILSTKRFALSTFCWKQGHQQRASTFQGFCPLCLSHWRKGWSTRCSAKGGVRASKLSFARFSSLCFFSLSLSQCSDKSGMIQQNWARRCS